MIVEKKHQFRYQIRKLLLVLVALCCLGPAGYWLGTTGQTRLAFLQAAGIDEYTRDPHILFHITYHNEAWRTIHQGLLITNDGKIIGYNDGSRSDLPDFSYPLTQWEIVDKMGSSQVVLGRVEQWQLRKMRELVAPVGRGEIVLEDGRMFDAGYWQYYAYEYHAEQGRYMPVLIQQTGNYSQTNGSDAGLTLAEFLNEIAVACLGELNIDCWR